MGTISLSETTQIKFYVDEYKGYKYGSVRTFIQGDSYTGPTKSGITLNAGLLDGVIPVLERLPKQPDTLEDKELARFPKKAGVELVVRITIFRDTTGVDLREWVEDSSYKGWSKKGVRIPYKEVQQAVAYLKEMRQLVAKE
ncbi:MAG: PC4/YdbC family ssDNA-binding protein [Elusimicrobia bacterium]|nr:PC4/YdbC family ssDNA-binding protein [Elusimicrobiota bacterium]